MSSGILNERVREELESLVRETNEIGLQVAAYLEGELVVDAWAGTADPATSRPVQGDSLFMSSSSSKGLAATCIHACADRLGLSYDMPIADVWPEFAAHGKEAATLRHALCHQTGVPQTPPGYRPGWLTDWDRMCRAIADLPPMFPPGSRTAYHSTTFGYIVGEVLRRVDGRPIAQFLTEEICAPLGIDAYFGVPDDEMHRVAVLVDGPPAPEEYMGRLVGEPAGCRVAEVFNQPAILQASIPGSGGVFSARGLARHYAMLAGFGELGEVRILPSSRVRKATELQSYDIDEIYRIRVRRGLGYRLGADCGPLASPLAFGHVGGGGSFGYADPARRLAIGFTKNYFIHRTAIATSGKTLPSPAKRVAEAVFEALGL